ncbi:uncharacterized protein LOC121873244 isoform X2 [Homarus americanus]|nr:uncharacterized protein LOC121873244 isoform X2 [Homarus americanus]
MATIKEEIDFEFIEIKEEKLDFVVEEEGTEFSEADKCEVQQHDSSSAETDTCTQEDRLSCIEYSSYTDTTEQSIVTPQPTSSKLTSLRIKQEEMNIEQIGGGPLPNTLGSTMSLELTVCNSVVETYASHPVNEAGDPIMDVKISFGKCQTLWNKVGRSAVTAETVKAEFKLQLIRPNPTRWNSTFRAVERILHINQNQGEDAIKNICSSFSIKMLSPVELEFLTEYLYHTMMKSVSKALDMLQSEASTHMGWLLPILYQLKTNFDKIYISAKLCRPLITAFTSGIEKRFATMLEDPKLIAAAILRQNLRIYGPARILFSIKEWITLCLRWRSYTMRAPPIKKISYTSQASASVCRKERVKFILSQVF